MIKSSPLSGFLPRLFLYTHSLREKLHSLLRVLELIQSAINSLLMQQLLVGTFFHDPTLVHHNDAVDVADRQKSTGDNDGGTVQHQLIQSVL